jgi:Zn-dependent peptidase ImmA (M78 family)
LIWPSGGQCFHDLVPDASSPPANEAISSKGEDNDEREANLFAAELLMPAKFLREDLEGVELDLLGDSKFLTDLAKKYSVSLQALTFRLTYLRYITD